MEQWPGWFGCILFKSINKKGNKFIDTDNYDISTHIQNVCKFVSESDNYEMKEASPLINCQTK